MGHDAGVADIGGWQNVRSVSWSGLRQALHLPPVTITISASSLFTQTQFQVMTQGGPLDATSVSFDNSMACSGVKG
jgi:ABC-type sugar transport system permease subunit